MLKATECAPSFILLIKHSFGAITLRYAFRQRMGLVARILTLSIRGRSEYGVGLGGRGMGMGGCLIERARSLVSGCVCLWPRCADIDQTYVSCVIMSALASRPHYE